MTRKYEEIKYHIEEENDKGCKLETSKEDYINTHQKLNLRCKCGTPFSVSFHEIISKNKLQCNECGFKISGEKQRKNGQEIYDYFESKDLIPQFNSEDYVNAHQLLPYICKYHIDKGVQTISYSNLKANYSCKYCKIDENRLVMKIKYKTIVEDADLIFHDLLFKNNKTKIQFSCPIHTDKGIQTMDQSNFISGQRCKYCGHEYVANIRRKDGKDVIISYINNGFEPLFNEDDYVNNSQKLPCICNKHREFGIIYSTYADVNSGKGCIECGKEKISGENHYLWKGGISPLHNYLRYKINDWKRDSLKQYNFCCGITGIQSNNLVVHHMYGFNLILDEVLFELNLDIRKEINLYSDKELLLIENLLVKKHYEYGLGIPLLPYIHDIYHKIYGRGNNTCEEFNEFKIDYLNGKYNYLKAVG